MNVEFKRLNHIQLCIPLGKEEEARAFYCGVLGLQEIEKPEDLRKNGGLWLQIADIELHIGTEDLQNHSKRHPAFEVAKIETIKTALKAQGIRIKEDNPLPKYHRFSFFDPFNNRIELLEEKSREELAFLGKEVQVQIDRPIQSKHPEHGFVYALNYGFVPGTKAADGEAIDVYILGEDRPIASYTGIVKGIINRYNDQENKLLVAAPHYTTSKEEVERMTHFQEQFFDIQIIWHGD